MDPLTEIKTVVKTYLQEQSAFQEKVTIQDTTFLITGGVLDSVGILKLIAFLEERYPVQFKAHEIDVDCFNTINDIAKTVQSKIQKKM